MKIDEKRFNRWFSAFILIGMVVATCFVTGYRLNKADSGYLWILLSAFSSIMGVIATVCSANGWIITFLFGLLDVSVYGAVCGHAWLAGGGGLGQAILHFAYLVPMQIVGFVQWRKRGAHASEKVKPRRLTEKQRWLLAGLCVLVSLVTYFVLLRFDRSAAVTFIKLTVLMDAIALISNIVGQFLMSTAYMEQWILWLAVNVSSIIMWSLSDEDYAPVCIVKYSFYMINALNGLRIWLKLSKEEKIS